MGSKPSTFKFVNADNTCEEVNIWTIQHITVNPDTNNIHSKVVACVDSYDSVAEVLGEFCMQHIKHYGLICTLKKLDMPVREAFRQFENNFIDNLFIVQHFNEYDNIMNVFEDNDDRCEVYTIEVCAVDSSTIEDIVNETLSDVIDTIVIDDKE